MAIEVWLENFLDKIVDEGMLANCVAMNFLMNLQTGRLPVSAVLVPFLVMMC